MQKCFTILTGFLLWFAPNTSEAQSTYFSNIYDFYGQWEAGWNVVTLDSGYIAVGGVGDSLSGNGRIGVFYIDSLGNEIWKKSYGQGGLYYYPGTAGSFTSTNDGGYVLGGSVNYPSGDSNAMLWRFNNSGDTLWTKAIGADSLYEAAYQCKETKDSGFVLIGAVSDGNNIDMLLIKTDNLGNVEWQQTYNGYGFTVDVCNDGGYILGGQNCPGNNCQTHVVKVDSVGNFEWQEMFGGPYGENGAFVRQTSDGGYIIASDTVHYMTGPYPNSQLFLIKLDSSGNRQWSKAYGEVGIYHTLNMVRELPGGGFIAAGQMLDNYVDGVLLRVDAQGDSLWLRTLGNCNFSEESLLDVQLTSDGGFVATGTLSSNDCGNPSQDFWVVKVDSMGCDTPDCDAVGVVEQLAIGNEQLAVKVYPNPSDGKFTFEISNLAYRQAGDEQRMSNVEVLIYDMMGRLAGSKQLTTGKNEIDLTNQADGIYFYRVAANGQFVTGKLIIH